MYSDRHVSFTQLKNIYTEIISRSNLNVLLPDQNPLLDFDNLVAAQLGGNKCYTLYDFPKKEYCRWHLVKEVFGYTDDEFTTKAVNNDDFVKIKLIHPDHIDHKKRYSGILFEHILTSETDFRVRMDYYAVSFKLLHKDGRYLPVRRRSLIFEISKEKEILFRIDEWEVLSRYEANYVLPELSMSSNIKKTNELNEKFYLKNLELLKLDKDLTPQLLRILNYKLKFETDKKIASELNISIRTVENKFNEISRILREKLKSKAKRVLEIKKLAKTWGLYPVPSTLLLNRTK